MKIAISGKGGTGKSTVAAALALLMAGRGRKVLAVDADPDANLASALGIGVHEQAKLHTIACERALIEERTGARVREPGQIFRLNPRVSDIADNFAHQHRGVSLVVLGAVQSGGGGCACPESTLLRALVSELVLRRDEALIMDMEAGVEHLGRATAGAVDALLVVVEPGQRAVESARRIDTMAREIGIPRTYLVANKIRAPGDLSFVTQELPQLPLVGVIPFAESLVRADRAGVAVIDAIDDTTRVQLETLLAALDQRFGAAAAAALPSELGRHKMATATATEIRQL